jgi:hypothetical protein
MNPIRRWAASLSRTSFVVLLGLGVTGAIGLNAAARSRVWAYDEAITPAAVRQEQADLARRVEREARADYARLAGQPVSDHPPAAVAESLARLAEVRRRDATRLLAGRQARLRQTARLLHAAEAISWLVLLLLAYVAWGHLSVRRPEGGAS